MHYLAYLKKLLLIKSAGKAAGHACGNPPIRHKLSTAAAISTNECLAANKMQGTFVLRRTPAEEGGSGKVIYGSAKVFSMMVDIAPSLASSAQKCCKCWWLHWQ